MVVGSETGAEYTESRVWRGGGAGCTQPSYYAYTLYYVVATENRRYRMDKYERHTTKHFSTRTPLH